MAATAGGVCGGGLCPREAKPLHTGWSLELGSPLCAVHWLRDGDATEGALVGLQPLIKKAPAGPELRFLSPPRR